MKIIIFTASPQRDKLIDHLLAEKLTIRGHEVFVRELPHGYQQNIMTIQPDIIMVPPIRNFFSLEMCNTAGKMGISTIIRHVEPSCDESDIKNMSSLWKQMLLAARPEYVKLELVWGEYEAKIVKQHYPNLDIKSVGAFVADIYKNEGYIGLVGDFNKFNEKHGFDKNKPILTISSSWGLLDIESDHQGQSTRIMTKDSQAKAAWLEMIRKVHSELKDEWNILLRPHPGLADESYKGIVDELGIRIDLTSTAATVLVYSNALIHAGSTMALEMHWLDKPSFQFGDINSLDLPDGNWWQRRDVSISKVSPFYTDVSKMVKVIRNRSCESNANEEAIKDLEQGRYGSMDGKATDRAVDLICKVEGSFQHCWPSSNKNYDTPISFRHFDYMLRKVKCQVCMGDFYIVNQNWLNQLSKFYQLNRPLKTEGIMACPLCAHPLTGNIRYLEMSNE